MAESKPSLKGSEWWNYETFTLAYVFGMGAFTGCTYAIAAGEARPSGEALAVYLTFISATFAASLGWFSTRLSDRITDNRKVRRRVLTYIATIDLLRRECVHLQMIVDRVTQNGKIDIARDGSNIEVRQAAGIVIAMDRVHRTAMDTSPDLDDLIDSADEAKLCATVQSQIKYLQDIFSDLGDWRLRLPSVARKLTAEHFSASSSPISASINVFESAIAYYRQRVGV